MYVIENQLYKNNHVIILLGLQQIINAIIAKLSLSQSVFSPRMANKKPERIATPILNSSNLDGIDSVYVSRERLVLPRTTRCLSERSTEYQHQFTTVYIPSQPQLQIISTAAAIFLLTVVSNIKVCRWLH